MTPTSSRSGQARLAALFDEIEKISHETTAPPLSQPPPAKRPDWKRVLKGGAAYAAGYGVGHVGGMGIERGLSAAFGNKWPQMSRESRMKILYPALGVATVAGMAIGHASALRRQQLLEGDE